MDKALIACRAVHFVSVMVVFGGAAFRVYAIQGADAVVLAAVDTRLRDLLLAVASVALLSAVALVPMTASRMAGSTTALLEWKTISAVLLRTSFGAVWRWHLLLAVLLVIACSMTTMRPGYRMALSALLLACLGWVGHATIGEGRVAVAHQLNQSVHLLAGGIWLGGLVPLAALIARTRRAESATWQALLRQALPQFSHIGYVAVTLVAITGLVNTAILVGSVDALTGTAYGQLLLVKIALFLLLVSVAIVNRAILVPRVGRGSTQANSTAALMWTVGTEQALGLGILVVVSILGTWPPAMHHY